MTKKTTKPYAYRIRPLAKSDVKYGESVIRPSHREVLTGQINGMKASDLEERVGRALDKLEIPFQFRVRITAEALGSQHLTSHFANTRGEAEIDMLCNHLGQTVPIFVDGQISHFFSATQAEKDKEKTEITDTFGKRFGWKESVRVPFWKLIDQEMADRTIRDIFI